MLRDELIRLNMARYRLLNRVPKHLLSMAQAGGTGCYPIDRLFSNSLISEEGFGPALKNRLDKISYPYESTRAQKHRPTSTYEKLEKHGLAKALFEQHVLSLLKMWSDFPEYWSRHNEIHSSNTVKGKNFRQFHNTLAKELTRHAATVRDLRSGYELGEEWVGSYLRSVEWRLLDELLVLRTYIELKPETTTMATREAVLGVYGEVCSVFRTTNVKNNALACHLTSVICSPTCLVTGMLDPNPENVRKLISRQPDKSSKQSRN